ncbi:MAG: acetate/propionate family kinase, partial [Notoacmeibacter sp.]
MVSNHILTLNAGSSSLKFALFSDLELECKAIGQIEGLGTDPKLTLRDGKGTKILSDDLEGANAVADHTAALARIILEIEQRFPQAKIGKVGHRVVHGGIKFTSSTLVDQAVMTELEGLKSLAPLHQPHNLAGIKAALAAFPGAPQVACFDTAFHRSHPFVNDTFALPRELYDEGVRRYGFHGLSYEYVAGKLEELAPHHARGRVVICHLGSGASMCGLRNSQSIASTMGFSALDGLPMGTRPGQLDPGVVLYLLQEKGMTPDEVSDLLYKKSGLKGLSGISNDMRDLEASAEPHAKEAIDYFVFRVRREIGAMAAVLEGLDAVVFCGGIGENSRQIREYVLEAMEWIGVELDLSRNRANETVISSDRSRVRVLVIPT